MANCSWVGIDLHRSRSRVAVLDDRGGELISRAAANDPQTFLELLAEIDGAPGGRPGPLRGERSSESLRRPKGHARRDRPRRRPGRH
jgi:hypothetical protein